MKTPAIQEALLRYFIKRQHNYCCNNFSGAGYDECDVITISKSLYVQEIEVKVSRSDFKKDFKKVSKHQRLQAGFIRGYNKIPNRFYYCCPDGLIKPEEVPEYAGLIYASGFILKEEKEVHYDIQIIKKAPLIHKEKAESGLVFRMCHTLSVRSVYGCSLVTFRNKRNKQYFNERTNNI